MFLFFFPISLFHSLNTSPASSAPSSTSHPPTLSFPLSFNHHNLFNTSWQPSLLPASSFLPTTFSFAPPHPHPYPPPIKLPCLYRLNPLFFFSNHPSPLLPSPHSPPDSSPSNPACNHQQLIDSRKIFGGFARDIPTYESLSSLSHQLVILSVLSSPTLVPKFWWPNWLEMFFPFLHGHGTW